MGGSPCPTSRPHRLSCHARRPQNRFFTVRFLGDDSTITLADGRLSLRESSAIETLLSRSERRLSARRQWHRGRMKMKAMTSHRTAKTTKPAKTRNSGVRRLVAAFFFQQGILPHRLDLRNQTLHSIQRSNLHCHRTGAPLRYALVVTHRSCPVGTCENSPAIDRWVKLPKMLSLSGFPAINRWATIRCPYGTTRRHATAAVANSSGGHPFSAHLDLDFFEFPERSVTVGGG